MCIREISNIILIFPKIGSIRPVQLKIKLPSPNSEIERVGGEEVGSGEGTKSVDREGESN